ncbi:MAG: hypothetical protein LQ340_003712 [Diploschistes diacapsis]|nr:MAG: hypothetical protein LQ340_003712 [Diploschistes diacapsis]
MSAFGSICICVIGVGFVGESLLKNFGRIFRCIGYDTSEYRINRLKSDGTFDHLPQKVELTTNSSNLSHGTHYLIAVPTPVREDRSVNLDFVIAAVQAVFRHAKRGSTIVIESTVPVGTTQELLGPSKHLFNGGMSPERIDPGRVEPPTHQIPKIVSGLTPKALKHIASIYSQVFEEIVEVSKPEAAEMTKLYENCYRMINIAYVNEISDACRAHAINPDEVIDAATTKPFGFQAFYPGLGVGGHCIPVNPYYLFANNRLPMLEKATSMMLQRPQKMAVRFHQRCMTRYLSNSTADPPSPLTEPFSPPRVLVVGIAFKPGQSDISSSPALAFAKSLSDTGCERLAFYDPLVKEKIPWLEKLHKRRWNRTYLDREFDGIAVCLKQKQINFSVLRGLKHAFVWKFVALDNPKVFQDRSSGKPNSLGFEPILPLIDTANVSLMPKAYYAYGETINGYA